MNVRYGALRIRSRTLSDVFGHQNHLANRYAPNDGQSLPNFLLSRELTTLAIGRATVRIDRVGWAATSRVHPRVGVSPASTGATFGAPCAETRSQSRQILGSKTECGYRIIRTSSQSKRQDQSDSSPFFSFHP